MCTIMTDQWQFNSHDVSLSYYLLVPDGGMFMLTYTETRCTLQVCQVGYSKLFQNHGTVRTKSQNTWHTTSRGLYYTQSVTPSFRRVIIIKYLDSYNK